jgi:hypothetical protein
MDYFIPIASYVLMFYLIYLAFKKFAIVLIPRFSTLDNKTKEISYGKLVSAVNALTMIVKTFSFWITQNKFFSIEFNSYRTSEQLTICSMIGYLIYDFIHDISIGNFEYDITIHHFLGIISHASTLYTGNNSAMFYTMVIYLAETSTPFLNTSWLLHQLKFDNTMLFKICAGLLLVTFFLYRVILAPVVLYHLIIHRQTWGEKTIDKAMFYGNFSIIFLFAILNMFWFYMMISKFLNTFFPSKKIVNIIEKDK